MVPEAALPALTGVGEGGGEAEETQPRHPASGLLSWGRDLRQLLTGKRLTWQIAHTLCRCTHILCTVTCSPHTCSVYIHSAL